MALRVQDAARRELREGDPVLVYTRMSMDPGHDELGVKRQEREIKELCRRRGLVVSAVLQDDDRSAFSGRPRKGYLEALERIERGEVRGVVTWHPDRLHRSPVELEAFIDLLERTGVTVVTVQGGEYDLGTAAGRMTARVVGAVARHESEHKSERIKAKMRELQRDNKFTGGGKRPFGYEKLEKGTHHQEVRPAEADVIRDLVKRVLAGESMLSLVRDLNERGVPTVGGGPWELSTVSLMLRSARIAGLRVVDGEEVTAPWPAIITPREHHEVKALLLSNRSNPRRSQRTYLLTGGIVHCAGCGAAMIGRILGRTGNKKPTYGCVKERGGCNRCFASAAHVDELVRLAIVDVVDSDALAERLARLSAEGLGDDVLAAIARQETLIREIEDDRLEGRIDRDEYHRQRNRARAKLEELRGSYRPNTRFFALHEWHDRSLADAWDSLGHGRQRAIIEALGLTVHIAPRGKGGRGFDPERVSFRWSV